MRIEIIKCDTCGKEIKGNPVAVTLDYVDRVTGEPTDDKKDTGEICISCARKLMMEFLNSEPSEQAKKPPKKKPTKVAIKDPEIIRIKGSEIEAYRRAGRTWDWIEDEAQVTVKTLKKIHKEWKKELEEKSQ